MNELKIVNQYEMILEKKIIIYGCGSSGRKLLCFMEMLGCRVVCFCDSDIQKRGNKVDGVEVCHKTDLGDLCDDNTILVIASVYYKEIIKDLSDYINLESVFTRFAFELSVRMHYKEMNLAMSALVNEYMECLKESELHWIESFFKRDTALNYSCLTDDNAVLVYQPGKAGSTSLWKACQQSGMKTAHVHTYREYSSNMQYINWCKEKCNQFRGKMIIPVREPIARDISDYFQIFGENLGVILEIYKFSNLNEGFYKMFCEYVLHKGDYKFQSHPITEDLYIHPRDGYLKYGHQFDFFEIELNRYFGIDVMQYPFDTQKGYSVIHQNGIDIFLLQSERMNELESELGEFLGVHQFKIQLQNVGEDKQYQYLYREFKENISVNKEYVDFYYKGNKAMEHFYSEEQREAFYNKWLKYVQS
ncbi:MAG: hypothetical protein HFH72_03015 [Lachnospiraceae bacterium]|nr:hypothetical protein [Lachnospiraceae bacterium]